MRRKERTRPRTTRPEQNHLYLKLAKQTKTQNRQYIKIAGTSFCSKGTKSWRDSKQSTTDTTHHASKLLAPYLKGTEHSHQHHEEHAWGVYSIKWQMACCGPQRLSNFIDLRSCPVSNKEIQQCIHKTKNIQAACQKVSHINIPEDINFKLAHSSIKENRLPAWLLFI